MGDPTLCLPGIVTSEMTRRYEVSEMWWLSDLVWTLCWDRAGQGRSRLPLYFCRLLVMVAACALAAAMCCCVLQKSFTFCSSSSAAPVPGSWAATSSWPWPFILVCFVDFWIWILEPKPVFKINFTLVPPKLFHRGRLVGRSVSWYSRCGIFSSQSVWIHWYREQARKETNKSTLLR